MRQFLPIGQSRSDTILVAALLLFSPGAQAQVGAVHDLLIANICMIQNWDTPAMQTWLGKKSRQERMQTFGRLKFSSELKRCLMKEKAAPVALCDKLIASSVDLRENSVPGGGAPFPELTGEEENTILERFENSKCSSVQDSTTAVDWVPADLNPSAATMRLLERAKKGDRLAQLQAVDLYTSGADVPPNVDRAAYWMRQAAISGDAQSQVELGWRYYIGKEPYSVDFAQAIHFLTLAANQGNRDAMALLGRVYMEDEPAYGETGKTKRRKDVVKAMSWLVKAADLGDADAAAWLGHIYGSGEHVPIDAAKAFSWFKKSAENLNAQSMLKLSEFYEKGVATTKDVKMAQQLRRRADALGVNGDLIRYFPWQDMPKDAASAARIQLTHAAAGDVDAQLAIAMRYFDGDGVKKDGTIATSWWRKAANAGDPIGQRMLGESLMNGWDSTKKESNDAGLPWLQKAMAQGDTAAQVMLAYWHANGGAAQNSQERKLHIVEGVRLMRQAAERGYRPGDSRERADKWERLLNE